jgi:hypothetical protein
LPSEGENYQKLLNALDDITETVGLPPLKDDIAKSLPNGVQEEALK